jgi:hypothetical protein
VNETHMVNQRKAPNFTSLFSTQIKAYFYFDFEFEYRKHRTIKGMQIDSQEMLKVL